MWLANLTLTQIYVPLTLTAGLTQMWSLSVEVTFYLALPFLALLARRLPVRARIPVIAVVALASLAWGLIPFDPPFGVNPLNWPPAFFAWFAAGMVIAELTVSPVGWAHRLARRRVLVADRRADRVRDRGVTVGGSGRTDTRHGWASSW